jgi:hypothetical protein
MHQEYTPSNAVQRTKSEGLAYSLRQLPEPSSPMPAACRGMYWPDHPSQVHSTLSMPALQPLGAQPLYCRQGPAVGHFRVALLGLHAFLRAAEWVSVSGPLLEVNLTALLL